MNLATPFVTHLISLSRSYPTLLYAIGAILGVGTSLFSLNFTFVCFTLAIFTTPLYLSSCKHYRYRLIMAATLAIATFSLCSARYQLPTKKEVKSGIAHIELESVKSTKTPFGAFWSYKGMLKEFTQNGEIIAKNLPVKISIPEEYGKSRPEATSIYKFTAKLKETDYRTFILSPVKNEPWIKVNKRYHLAEWRHSAKKAVQTHIESSIKNPHVSSFLSGIATGEFEDRFLSFELSRFGLQHLMAISGLHFSVIAGILGYMFRIFFRQDHAALFTIILMSCYFIFLGLSPSVTRAWLAITMGMCAFFIERQTSGLNALGCATLLIVLYDPFVIGELGFQFSFGITAMILLWHSPIDSFLQLIFSKRTLSEARKMDDVDRHGYCMLYFLRQTLALSFAVNLVALPLTLYHFHTFPLMSLVYNLFFPFLVSFSLIFLVLGGSIFLIFPWLGSAIHHLNESYTQYVLNFVFRFPKTYDISLKTASILKEWLLIYFLIVFLLGCHFHFKQKALTWT